jgi:CheY-like chemotaxis protein
MSNHPERVEVNYNLLMELFRIVGVKHSLQPTDDELHQLMLTMQEKLSTLDKKEKQELEKIHDLLALDPVPKHVKPPEKSQSILVVDDLVMVTYQLSILLSKIGYKVNLARSAPEAISFFKSSYYKYVLMDLHLPEKEDGMFLLHSLKNKIDMEALDTKIIVMSGMADAASVEYCLNHGAHSFIEKNEDWKKDIIDCLNSL